MENWFFTNFLSDLQVTLSFYSALESNTILLQRFFCFVGDLLPSALLAPLHERGSGSISINGFVNSEFLANTFPYPHFLKVYSCIGGPEGGEILGTTPSPEIQKK